MPPKAKSSKPAKPAAPAKKSAPATRAKGGGHIFLIDGSSYIFRAYFAMFKAA